MAIVTTAIRPPVPPFTRESATQKVRLAEDAWNTRDPGKVSLAYAIDSRWRNRSEFINGRNGIIAFLSRKWATEFDYKLIKEMWGSPGIASRYASLTSGTTTPVVGIAPTAMRTGNSMRTGSWPHALRRSTTFQSWNQSVSITGCSGGAPTTIQD
jgi:hypothetical protein